MESHNHVTLKWKAMEWLYINANCRYVATEVKIGRYIFDVVKDFFMKRKLNDLCS